MCMENETITELEKEKKEIMEAVNIIKEFGPDVKAINVMLHDHARRIDEEKEERKKEDCEIKNNYIDRFDDLKKDIKEFKEEIKKAVEKKYEDTNKLLTGLFITILTMFIGSTVFLVLNNIYQWLK